MIQSAKKILSIGLFTAFLLAGWFFGFSPIKESLNIVRQQKEEITRKIEGGPFIAVPSDYIKSEQYLLDILHYDLTIDLYPAEKLLRGKAVLTGTASEDLDEIVLNFYENMKIGSLTVNGSPVKYKRDDMSMEIDFSISASDTFVIEIVYSGTPKRKGLSAFTFGEINNRSVVYNLNEPYFASTWFPCNDIPSDKALLDIRIINDSSMVSASNGILNGITIDGGRAKYHWKTYYPISTYLVCLYSSEYEKLTDKYVSLDKRDTMDIEYYVFPEHVNNAEKDFEEHPEMLRFFAGAFGEYPFIKEKYGVAEFLWQMGAMEHQTLTGIGSNFVSGRKFFNDVLVHELAHHWWGNAVGPKTWKDIWLNEGFSTYSEALYAEHVSGKKALQSTMLSKYNDDYRGTLYAPPIENLFSSTVYDKGAWVLHMLRWEVGDDNFFKILRTYYEEYKYSTASTEDFKEVCERISFKNLDKFFEQWVYEGESQIKADFKWSSKRDKDCYLIFLDLEQKQNDYKDFNFPLEIKLKTKKEVFYQTFYVNARQKSFEFGVDTEPISIELDPNNWLLAKFNNVTVNQD